MFWSLLVVAACSLGAAICETTAEKESYNTSNQSVVTGKPSSSPNVNRDKSGTKPKNPCELPGAFRCARDVHLCVGYEELCDGKMQCPNGADETGLVCALRTCRPDQHDCGFGGPPFPRCLNKSKLCNRVRDCANGDDEKNCTVPVCHDDQFQCSGDHHCIPTSWRCDKITDCGDGSDEKGCAESKSSVDEGEEDSGAEVTSAKPEETCDKDIAETFYCWSGRRPMDEEENIMNKLYGPKCIPFWFLCNGQYDCIDGADERNCHQRRPNDDDSRQPDRILQRAQKIFE